MKYLGIVVDRRLLFKAHISEAANNADKTANILGCLMPNIGGSKQLRRKLYVSVVQSVLLYGSPSWTDTLECVPNNATQLNKVQQKVLLRNICAYRTVTVTAANILAGVPPADLLAKERSAMFNEKRSDGHRTVVQSTAWKLRLPHHPAIVRTRLLWKLFVQNRKRGFQQVSSLAVPGRQDRARALRVYSMRRGERR